MGRKISRCIYYISYYNCYRRFKIVSDKPCNIIAKKFFGPELPDIDDLARNVSLVLVNSHFTTHQVRPVVPNFIEVAGLHINDNTTLPKVYLFSVKRITLFHLDYNSTAL